MSHLVFCHLCSGHKLHRPFYLKSWIKQCQFKKREATDRDRCLSVTTKESYLWTMAATPGIQLYHAGALGHIMKIKEQCLRLISPLDCVNRRIVGLMSESCDSPWGFDACQCGKLAHTRFLSMSFIQSDFSLFSRVLSYSNNGRLNSWILQASPTDLGNIPLTALLLERQKKKKKNPHQRCFFSPFFLSAIHERRWWETQFPS